MLEFHGVGGAPLGQRAQRGGVAEHLVQRHFGLIALLPGRSSMPRMTPRREERSPITSPIFSSAVSTSTAMIGSSSTGLAARMPSLKAKMAAILNAFSFESTSW